MRLRSVRQGGINRTSHMHDVSLFNPELEVSEVAEVSQATQTRSSSRASRQASKPSTLAGAKHMNECML